MHANWPQRSRRGRARSRKRGEDLIAVAEVLPSSLIHQPPGIIKGNGLGEHVNVRILNVRTAGVLSQEITGSARHARVRSQLAAEAIGIDSKLVGLALR